MLGLRRPLAVPVLAFVAIGVTEPARAEGPRATLPLTLDWTAPEGCPTQTQLVAAIGRIAGNAARRPATRPLVVHAAVERASASQWRASVVAEGRGLSGRRQFDAESCDAVADATARIVALMIDEAQVPSSPPSVVEAAPTPAPPVAPVVRLEPANPPPAATPATKAPRLFRGVLVRLSVAGDLGTLATVDLGGELTAGATLGRVRLEASASYWADRRATAPGRAAEGAELGLFCFGGRAGYVFEVLPFTFVPFLGAEVDRVSASGFGGTSTFQQTAVWAGIDLGATASWAVGHGFAVSWTLEGVAPTSRPPFVALQPAPEPSIQVERSWAVFGRTFLGVERRFF